MTEEDNDIPLLSVVIIGLNEAERIGPCIDNIKTAVADIPDTEIVYVDSGSADDTPAIALSKGVRVFQLGKAQPPSPAAGRYVGSLVTHGRFIMFVDGDTIVAPGWSSPAIKLMARDDSVAMFAGRAPTDQHGARVPPPVKTLGKIKTAGHQISTSRAPIISREILVKAGNWNPFLRCREEADLAIRIRHYIAGSQLLESDQYTVFTPKTRNYMPREFLRRYKRGFVKGPGQILRNALVHGYWRKCWHICKIILLPSVLLLGLAISIPLGLWWQFLLLFFGVSVLRAIVTRRLIRLGSVFYSLLLGFGSLWELITTPAKNATDYVRDFQEIHGPTKPNAHDNG